MRLTEQWSKVSVGRRASLALMFSMLVEKAIAFISTPILTRIMDFEQYGIAATFASWQNVILIVATLSLGMGVFNNGMLEFKDERDEFTASALVLSNVSTIAVFGVYVLLYRYLSPVVGLSNSMMAVMFVYLLFNPAYTFWACRERYELRYKRLLLFSILIAVLRFGLGIAAVLVVEAQQQALAKVAVTELVLIGFGIVMYIRSFVQSRMKISFRFIKYAFVFNIFLIPHFLATTVLASSDRIMINTLVGSAEVGIYSVAYSAAWIIIVSWQAIEASWTPWLFEHLQSGNHKPIKKQANEIISMLAVLTLFCVLLAPEIMKILVSSEYYDSIYIVPSVTAGAFFTGVYSLYMRVEYYAKKTQASMFGAIIAALANVGLNYWLIPIIGYQVAGYTTLFCYAILALYHGIYARRWKLHLIYDNRVILMLSLLVPAASLTIMWTYSHPVIRYSIIAMLLLAGIAFRRTLMSVVRDVVRGETAAD